MKRFLAVLLAAVLCVSLAGCSLFDGFRYIKAMNLYEDGAYDEALVMFTELADYADSQAMAKRCGQIVDYAKAEELYAAGEYDAALALYSGLMLYEDSPIKAVLCQYALGDGCMAAGDYSKAAEWFEGLGGYEDAPEKLREAKWMWLWSYLMENGAAEFAIDTEGAKNLSLSAIEEGELLLTYTAEGALLGMPYRDELSVTFGRTSGEASYTAYCSSEAGSTIVEEADGTLELAAFQPGAGVEMAHFRQTTTVKLLDGSEPVEPVITEDPAQMVRLKGMFLAAQTAVAENLPALLEETGVPVTAGELGFTITE